MAALDYDDSWRQSLRRYRWQFVDLYPDLNDWFERPLSERVTWTKRTSKKVWREDDPGDGVDFRTARINYYARPYLVCLALSGRIHMDWPWLFGRGFLRIEATATAFGLSLADDLADIYKRQTGLGMSTHDQRRRVSWSIPRLMLHNGISDMSQLTSEHVAEMRQAIFRRRDP
jgi:hypothetical protein